jgi:hypothetical protein
MTVLGITKGTKVRWESWEEALLNESVAANTPFNLICEKINRTEGAIIQKCKVMKIDKKINGLKEVQARLVKEGNDKRKATAEKLNSSKNKEWSAEDDAYLETNYKNMTNKNLAKQLGRTVPAVIKRNQTLRIKKLGTKTISVTNTTSEIANKLNTPFMVLKSTSLLNDTETSGSVYINNKLVFADTNVDVARGYALAMKSIVKGKNNQIIFKTIKTVTTEEMI